MGKKVCGALKQKNEDILIGDALMEEKVYFEGILEQNADKK
jgi:hypothetical protein